MVDTAGPEPASVRIQTVVYHNDLAQIRRLIAGLGAAVRRARGQGVVGAVELRVGDSTEPSRAEASAGMVAEWAGEAGLDDVLYDRFGDNLGSAAGNNRLADGAATDFLLFVNPDTYAAPSMLVEMRRACAPGIGAVEARQIPAEHPKHYDRETGITGWVSSAALLVATAAFAEVGGFDADSFFLHVDDVDLSWRLRLAGYDLVTAPGAVVFHDKRFHADGRVIAPEAERYHDIHGRLMLAHKYGLSDLAARITRFVEGNGDDVQRRALADFHGRESSGRLPDPIPGASTVAETDAGRLTRNRF